MTPLRLEAPAKLNLSLRVVGRRDDGLHLLDSELVLLELADRLLLLPGSSGLRVDGDAVARVPLDAREPRLARPVGPASAGSRTSSAWPSRSGSRRPPGLGGGSSDAAAAWRLGRASRGVTARADADGARGAVARSAPTSRSSRPEVAAARVGGIGERVEAVPAPSPARRPRCTRPSGCRRPTSSPSCDPTSGGAARTTCCRAARRLRPELDALFALVAAAGGEPRLTGSGPDDLHPGRRRRVGGRHRGIASSERAPAPP